VISKKKWKPAHLEELSLWEVDAENEDLQAAKELAGRERLKSAQLLNKRSTIKLPP
jgi:hypothetical protein